MAIPKLIDITNDCYIKRYDEFSLSHRAIFYKDVPLWNTIARDLKGHEIFLADRDEHDPHTIYCRDDLGDLFVYGAWETLEEAKEWLKNPKELY